MIRSNQLLVWNNITLHLIILFDIVLCALHYMIFLPYYSVPNLSILSCIFIFYLSSFILLFCAVLYRICIVLYYRSITTADRTDSKQQRRNGSRTILMGFGEHFSRCEWLQRLALRCWHTRASTMAIRSVHQNQYFST